MNPVSLAILKVRVLRQFVAVFCALLTGSSTHNHEKHTQGRCGGGRQPQPQKRAKRNSSRYKNRCPRLGTNRNLSLSI